MDKKIVTTLVIVFVLLIGCTQQTAPNNTGGNTTTPGPVEIPLTASVSISGFAFNPGTLTVAAGTIVTWTNNDSMQHTVTGGELDSQKLAQGQTYSHTFNTPGTIDYICTIHPSMKGKIIVQ
jgi:plastocyanin